GGGRRAPARAAARPPARALPLGAAARARGDPHPRELEVPPRRAELPDADDGPRARPPSPPAGAHRPRRGRGALPHAGGDRVGHRGHGERRDAPRHDRRAACGAGRVARGPRPAHRRRRGRAGRAAGAPAAGARGRARRAVRRHARERRGRARARPRRRRPRGGDRLPRGRDPRRALRRHGVDPVLLPRGRRRGGDGQRARARRDRRARVRRAVRRRRRGRDAAARGGRARRGRRRPRNDTHPRGRPRGRIGGVMEPGRDYGIVDIDAHIIEPPNLWREYVEPRFRDQAIRVERTADGMNRFVVRGRPSRVFPALTPLYPGQHDVMRKMTRQERCALTNQLLHQDYAEASAEGAIDPSDRVAILDRQGIEAALLFPTLGLSWEEDVLDDPEYTLASMRAYNTWITEFCATAPDRLWAVAHLSL